MGLAYAADSVYQVAGRVVLSLLGKRNSGFLIETHRHFLLGTAAEGTTKIGDSCVLVRDCFGKQLPNPELIRLFSSKRFQHPNGLIGLPHGDVHLRQEIGRVGVVAVLLVESLLRGDESGYLGGIATPRKVFAYLTV